MGEYFDQIPGHIQGHVRELTKSSGMPDDDEYLEMISEAWLEKKRIFEEKIENAEMDEIESFDNSDDRGVLALTYSGSLINIGPRIDNIRNLEYTSVGLRSDVPDAVTEPASEIDGDISIDVPIKFTTGRVKNTSAIFKISVPHEDLTPEEQIEMLDEVTMILRDEFVDVNKTLIMDM